MSISKETVLHVAKLSRLKIEESQIEKMTEDMGNIIGFMDKLNELDTENVTPTAHVIPITNVFREDEVAKSYDREKILANAPTQENGCFKVPKVVE